MRVPSARFRERSCSKAHGFSSVSMAVADLARCAKHAMPSPAREPISATSLPTKRASSAVCTACGDRCGELSSVRGTRRVHSSRAAGGPRGQRYQPQKHPARATRVAGRDRLVPLQSSESTPRMSSAPARMAASPPTTLTWARSKQPTRTRTPATTKSRTTSKRVRAPRFQLPDVTQTSSGLARLRSTRTLAPSP